MIFVESVEEGHFYFLRPYTDKAEWVSNFGGELEVTNTIRKCLKCSKNINSSRHIINIVILVLKIIYK